MKVNSRPNLAAYISVDSDPGPDYGKITVLKLPTNSVIDGPEQIFNSFNTTPAISKDITLLGSGGSQVMHGNLLTLPIGNSFLYVEPLYVQGATSTGYPVLQTDPGRVRRQDRLRRQRRRRAGQSQPGRRRDHRQRHRGIVQYDDDSDVDAADTHRQRQLAAIFQRTSDWIVGVRRPPRRPCCNS